MFVEGKELIGEFGSIVKITKYWKQVDIDWLDYELKYQEYSGIANQSSGCWVALCDNDHACLRFEQEEDAQKFKELYFEEDVYGIAI